MSAIDFIRDKHKSHRTRIEVPEWGPKGEPLVIYSRYYTLRLEESYIELSKTRPALAYAKLIADLALDEEGKRIFEDGDEVSLLGFGHGDVVKRVADQMMSAISTEVSEAKKNSSVTEDSEPSSKSPNGGATALSVN